MLSTNNNYTEDYNEVSTGVSVAPSQTNPSQTNPSHTNPSQTNTYQVTPIESIPTNQNILNEYKSEGYKNEIDKEVVKEFHKSESSIFSNFFNNQDIVVNDKPIINEINNFGNIPIKQTDAFIENNKPEPNIYVKYRDNKFTFRDDTNYLGHFTINNLIKYFSSVYDVNNQFMSNINKTEHNNAIYLIKTFIGSVKYDPITKFANIILLTHNESPLMGDIEMLMYLNKALESFEKNKLYEELNSVSINSSINVRGKIERIIKQTIYIMLNYTLGIISLISDDIKDDVNKKELKKNLLNYSINIVYRISKFVQEQVGVAINMNEELEKIFLINLKLKNILINKFDNFINDVKSGKELKFNLNQQDNNLNQQGGNKNNSYSSTSDDYDSDLDSINSSDFSDYHSAIIELD